MVSPPKFGLVPEGGAVQGGEASAHWDSVSSDSSCGADGGIEMQRLRPSAVSPSSQQLRQPDTVQSPVVTDRPLSTRRAVALVLAPAAVRALSGAVTDDGADGDGGVSLAGSILVGTSPKVTGGESALIYTIKDLVNRVLAVI